MFSKKLPLTLGALFLSAIAGSISFPILAVAQYGLGLSSSAGSSGGTRGELPALTLIVPEDGAKTLSARPTLYWYVAPTEYSTSELQTPKIRKQQFEVELILRAQNEKSAKAIYSLKGVAENSGLYKFTLPENLPELVKNQTQSWQVRVQSGLESQVNAYGVIRREDNVAVSKEISLAKSDLDKARIYSKNLYWYDAIDAYTTWLSANPKDEIARCERNSLLILGFEKHSAFNNPLTPEIKVNGLLYKLNEKFTPNEIKLQPK